ncbi:MAG: putative amidohydrolase YtcJ [Minisyncoccia bacterium]
MFDERRRATSQPRKVADFVVLDQDITASEPGSVADTRVLSTEVGVNFKEDSVSLAV